MLDAFVQLDGSMPDAPVDAASACAAPPSSGAFGTPLHVMTLSSAALDGTPSMTADGLEIFIKSSRAGGAGAADIWTAKRASKTAAWGSLVNVAELNTVAEETATEVSPDGLTLYFSSTRTGTLGDYDLYVTTRPDRSSAWSAPVHIVELSSPQLDEGIFVSADARVAYFQSDRESVGIATIYRSVRATPQATWSTPVKVAELDSGTGDENPWLSADDCTMYYQSARAGSLGLADLWVARRATPTSPFGTPTRVATVNSAAFDADPLLSADERYLMFVSNRAGGLGDFDIYESTR